MEETEMDELQEMWYLLPKGFFSEADILLIKESWREELPDADLADTFFIDI